MSAIPLSMHAASAKDSFGIPSQIWTCLVADRGWQCWHKGKESSVSDPDSLQQRFKPETGRGRRRGSGWVEQQGGGGRWMAEKSDRTKPYAKETGRGRD